MLFCCVAIHYSCEVLICYPMKPHKVNNVAVLTNKASQPNYPVICVLIGLVSKNIGTQTHRNFPLVLCFFLFLMLSSTSI